MQKLLFACLLTLPLAACDRAAVTAETPAQPARAEAVQVAAPLATLEQLSATASGEIRAVREATLSTKISGTLANVYVNVGNRVEVGHLLASIEDSTAAANVALARAALEAAKADLGIAELELQRQQQLMAAHAAARAQLDRAQATRDGSAARVSSAEASLVISQRSLADHRIRAPFAGVITARLKQAGESVSGTPQRGANGSCGSRRRRAARRRSAPSWWPRSTVSPCMSATSPASSTAPRRHAPPRPGTAGRRWRSRCRSSRAPTRWRSRSG